MTRKTIAGFGAARSGTTLITQMQIGKLIQYMVINESKKNIINTLQVIIY